MKDRREIQCTEVWGGTGGCDVSVKLAGVRGECYSRPFEGEEQEGGDIHFLSVCGISRLSKVVLADVSGHGHEAVAVSRIIHDALVESIGAHDNSTMLRQVNEAFLQRRTGAFKFTTMAALIIDSEDRSLVYAYAGHPAVLHGSAATGRFTPIQPQGQTGIPLGILAGTEYQQYVVQLAQGDVLVVYTDAFTEARTEDGELLGSAGLVRLLEEAGSMRPADLKEHVLGSMRRTPFDDDASLVILEVL
ncbi:MAG: PP2C family protein-serine/threonine phosphatase [Planctomycetota bacterium]|jgi:serine phosphatase RsbU (regulator of sigma subunit)